MMLRLPKPINSNQAGLPFMPWVFGRHGGHHIHGRHLWPFMGGHRCRSRYGDDSGHKDADGTEDTTNDKPNSTIQHSFNKHLKSCGQYWEDCLWSNLDISLAYFLATQKGTFGRHWYGHFYFGK